MALKKNPNKCLQEINHRDHIIHLDFSSNNLKSAPSVLSDKRKLAIFKKSQLVQIQTVKFEAKK